jgi:hypothetical protein
MVLLEKDKENQKTRNKILGTRIIIPCARIHAHNVYSLTKIPTMHLPSLKPIQLIRCMLRCKGFLETQSCETREDAVVSAQINSGRDCLQANKMSTSSKTDFSICSFETLDDN